jgi:hypothetical protein
VESWQTKKLYKECLQSLSGQIGLASAAPTPTSSAPTSVQVLEPLEPSDILEITKDYEHLSDFEVGRKVLRAIALNPNTRDSSRIQASIALIRSVEIGQDLPNHVREGIEEASIASERKKLEGLSAEELAREYQAELERLKAQ